MSSTKPLFAGSIIANYDRYLVPLFFEEVGLSRLPAARE